MKILAFEFSSPERSVAALDPASGREALGEAVESGSKSMQPLGLAERALNEAGMEREQIECIAVGLGPGSYTGIRAAIALAQGWQLARDVKLVGIGSVECIAAQAAAEGILGRLLAVIDAQRNELYIATYELSRESARREESASPDAEQRSVQYRELESLRLATVAQAREAATGDLTVVGPEVTRWFSNGRIIFPRAATVARLAVRRVDFRPGEEMKPIYLRETTFVKAKPVLRSE